jgi:hypothetical protein
MLGHLQDISAIIRPTTQEYYGNLTIHEGHSSSVFTDANRQRDRKIILPYLLIQPFKDAIWLNSASGKMAFEEKFILGDLRNFHDGFNYLTLGKLEYHGHNKNIKSVLALTLKGVDFPRGNDLHLPEYIRLCKGKIYLVKTRSYKSSEEPRESLEKQVKHVELDVRI